MSDEPGNNFADHLDEVYATRQPSEGGFAAGATTDGPVDSVPEEGENWPGPLYRARMARKVWTEEATNQTASVVSPVPVEGDEG